MSQFMQFKHIDPAHKPALEQTAMSHPKWTNNFLLARLYADAQAAAKSQPGQEQSVTNRITMDSLVLASATDKSTGVFVQLAYIGSLDTKPLMTVGRKWAMESANAQVGNVATTVW